MIRFSEEKLPRVTNYCYQRLLLLGCYELKSLYDSSSEQAFAESLL